jgi:hypothetical protein
MRGECARRTVRSRWSRGATCPGRVARDGVHGVNGPSVVRLDATGDVPVALRSQVALSAVVGCDRVTVPVSGASCRGLKVGDLKALHAGRRGGVAMDRYARLIKATRGRQYCQPEPLPWRSLRRYDLQNAEAADAHGVVRPRSGSIRPRSPVGSARGPTVECGSAVYLPAVCHVDCV